MRHEMHNPHREGGVYVVEFAIAASVFFFLLFAVLEVGRLMYTWNTLNAVTQRGARIAAVCPPNDPEVIRLTLQDNNGGPGASAMLPGFDESNLSITYLDDSNTVSNSIDTIRFVRVSIADYTYRTIIPNLLAGFTSPTLGSPGFATTVPAESLGWRPDINTRSCIA